MPLIEITFLALYPPPVINEQSRFGHSKLIFVFCFLFGFFNTAGVQTERKTISDFVSGLIPFDP